MRIRHTVDVHVTADAGTTSSLFGPDSVYNKAVLDTMTEVASGTQMISGGDAETISLGDVADARGLYLRVNAPCQVTINDGDPLPLRPGSVAAGSWAKLFVECDVTSLEVENTGTTELTCVYVIWGA